MTYIRHRYETMNENSLSACYITGSELLFILLQLIIVSFVELKGKT